VDGDLGPSTQFEPGEVVGGDHVDRYVAGRRCDADEIDVGAREQIDQRE
jgi:hypothetical protein